MAEIKTKSPQKQTYDENFKEAQKLLRTVFPDSKSPTAGGALKEYRAAAKLADDPKASPQAVMAQTVESLRTNAASSTIIKPLSTAADRIPTATPAEIAASNPPRAATAAPQSTPPQPAPPQPAPTDKVARDMQESVREMQGLMLFTGHYKGPLNGQPDKTTEEGLNKFLAERQIDPNKIPQDQLFSQVLQQLRGDVASSPRALEVMTQLKGQGADGISAVQYAMRSMGFPVPVTGTMNRQTFSGLKGLQERSAEAAANPPSAAEIRRAAPEPVSGKYKFDPDVQEAQKLLVANGLAEVTLKDGDKPKQMLIDGLNGPITNKGMADYKQKHGLGNEVSFADTLTHLRNSAKPAPAPVAPVTPAPSAIDAAAPADPAPVAATPPVEPAGPTPVAETTAAPVGGSGLKTTPFAAPPRSEPADRFDRPETDAMRNYTQQSQPAPPSRVQTMDGPSVTRALTSRHMQHIEKLAQGNGGMGGENAQADQKLIRDSLLRQAETDPNFVSKLDALSQHRVSLRVAKDSSEGIPGKPGVALGANAYEIRIDPRDLNNGAPLDTAIKGVIDGKQFNIQSLETNASIGGYALPARDKRQIYTDERDVRKLQGVLPESRVGRPVPPAPDEPVESSRGPGRRIARDDYDRPQPSRTAFRASAQVDLGAVAQMIDDRNYYKSLGWDPKLAATKASEIRMSNLLGQNMDQRSASLQVNAESRSADTQERHLNGVSRTYDRQVQAAIRQDQQDVNRFARSANRLTDIFTNGNPRDNSRGFGILAEEIVRATRTTGIPGLPNNGRPDDIYNTPRSGGFVRRLDVQDQFLYRPNQLTDAQFPGAARYGQHDRADIFAQGRKEQLALASAGSSAEIIQPAINPQQQIKMFPG